MQALAKYYRDGYLDFLKREGPDPGYPLARKILKESKENWESHAVKAVYLRIVLDDHSKAPTRCASDQLVWLCNEWAHKQEVEWHALHTRL